MRIPLPALALVLACSRLAAQAGVRVEGRRPPAPPSGASATAVFRVSSTSAAPVQVLPRVGLPAGWRLLTPEAAWSLAPGAAETRILSIVIPANAAAGDYAVRYAAGTGAGDSVLVRVAARRRVDVSVDGAPRFAVAGAGYAATFVVRNAGNAPVRVQLAARGDHGLAASPDATLLELAPGQARTVRAEVAAGGARDAHFTHTLTLAATAADDAAVTASSASRVEIVPAPGRTGARFHTVPAEVRLRGTGVDGAMSVSAALSAAGPVAGAGSPRVDVLLQGSDERPGLPGQPSVYRAALRSDTWNVALGDQVFALTPLTEPGAAGFGAGARVEGRWGEMAAFDARDRRYMGGTHRTGAAAALGPAWARVQGAWLSRVGRDAGTVRSLGAAVRPFRGATAEAEVARTAGAGSARMARVDYASPAFSVSAHHQDVDGDFGGRQRGVREDAASIRLGTGAGLRAEARVQRRDDGSAFVGPAAGLRSVRERAEAGLGWRSLATLRWTGERRQGTLFTGPFAREARSLSAEAALRAAGLWMRSGGEWGVGTDLRDGGDEAFRRLWMQAGARARGGAYLSLGVREQQGRGAQPIAPVQGWTGSVEAGLTVFGTTALHLGAQGTRWPSGTTGGAMDLSLSQGLPFGQRVVARTRSGVGAQPLGPAHAVSSVDYVVPVAMPVSPARRAGTAEGRLYDAQTGRGVAGVPVRVAGRVAVTDARGRWTVDGLRDGEHAVEPDRLAAGVGRIAADAAVVRMHGGRAARVETALVAGASVAGTLQPAGASAGELAGVVMVLRRDTLLVRRAVGPDGRFRFDDLPPGRWVLRAEAATLPAHQRLRGDSAVVDLAPGQAAALDAALAETARPIQIVAEAEVVVGSPATAPKRAAAATPLPIEGSRPERIARAAHTSRREARAVEWPAPAAAALEYDEVIGTYTVVAGDRDLVAISYLVYATGDLWPRLWLANRDVLPDPDRLVAGVELRIPAPGPLTAAERAELARRRARR